MTEGHPAAAWLGPRQGATRVVLGFPALLFQVPHSAGPLHAGGRPAQRSSKLVLFWVLLCSHEQICPAMVADISGKTAGAEWRVRHPA